MTSADTGRKNLSKGLVLSLASKVLACLYCLLGLWLHQIFHCPVNVFVFQCMCNASAVKNIEQQIVMHLPCPHMPLQTPKFVFVNSELVCFSDGATRGREPSW